MICQSSFFYAAKPTQTRQFHNLIMRHQNVRIASLMWLFIFLLLRQRSLMLQQTYLLFIMEEAFRISPQRNRRMLLMYLTRQLQHQRSPHRRRRAWVWPWPQNWFRLLIANPPLHFLWKEHFRVTRQRFEYLCDLVRADLQKQHTRMRVPVSVEERVGLALWRLATGNSYRSCGFSTVWPWKVNGEMHL